MSNPSKELESIINRHLAPLVFEARVSSGDVEGIIEEAKTLLIEIEELIALREREARIAENQTMRERVAGDTFDGDYFAEYFDNRLNELKKGEE